MPCTLITENKLYDNCSVKEYLSITSKQTNIGATASFNTVSY